MKKVICICMVTAMLLVGCSDFDLDEETTSNLENNSINNIVETEVQTETETESEIVTEVETTIDIESLSEEEYKNNCRQIYYEDINDDNVSKKEYVKVEIYLEQILMRDPYDAMADSLWQKNNLSLTYHSVGVLCRDFENNYGGENYILFQKDADLNATDYSRGSYYYVYGKVLQVTTNGWTGKKSLYLIPKYIDNK